MNNVTGTTVLHLGTPRLPPQRCADRERGRPRPPEAVDLQTPGVPDEAGEGVQPTSGDGLLSVSTGLRSLRR